MAKYALVNNNKVTAIIEKSDDESISQEIASNNSVIDITNQSPEPKVGWILNGNKLEVPSGQTSLEEYELELATKKTNFGMELSRRGVDRIGARNKILNKTGAQVTAMLMNLINLKMLLDTGALGTARATLVQFKALYPEYADIFQNAIDEINAFEQSNGL